MAFESVDASGESSLQKPFSEIGADAKSVPAKEKKTVGALLSFLQDLPPGAYSLLERLAILTFDQNTFLIHPKRLSAFNPKTAETYLVFDTVFKRAFFLSDLFDENQMRALQSGCEAQYGADIVWVPTEPESWTELHQHMVKQSSALKKDDKEQIEKVQYLIPQDGDDTDVRGEVNEDEIRRKVQALMNLGDLMRFFTTSLNKIKELEEALQQSIEEESEELAEEKRKRLKFKELLKHAIKEEIAKERLLVEELKRRQCESLSL